MGDLKNSVERLRKLLKATRYPPAQTNATFSVADLLRILHHTLLDYSRHVAAFVLEKGYDLYGKTDARFIDHCFRLMREEFDYFPSLNATQFLSAQFLERKIQLVADVLDVVVKKHDDCVRRRRQDQAVWTKPRELKTSSTHVENHVMPPTAPSVVTIDTWSLLEHLKRESKIKARQLKQSAQAKSPRQHDRQTHVRDLLPPRATSPDNQQVDEAARSDSTASRSGEERELKHSRRQRQNSSDRLETHAGCACGCSDTKAEVQEVLVTLSAQISDLTSAVLSRVSSIETRLGRVEQQLQELHVAKQTHSDPRAKPHTTAQPPDTHVATQRQEARSELSTASEGLRRFQTSWPPDPDMVGRGHY